MARIAKNALLATLLAALAVAACDRDRASPGTSSATVGAPPPALPVVAPSSSGSAKPNRVGTPPAPAEFEGLGTENLPGAVALGCEAQRTGAWLRLRCPVLHPKNGRMKEFAVVRGKEAHQLVHAPLGGTPAPGAAPATFAELVTPYRPGTRVDVDVAWERTRKRLELAWPSNVGAPEAIGRVTASASPAVLAACRALGPAVTSRIEAALAKKVVTAAQAALVPRNLNACHPAETGAWALTLDAIAAARCDGAPCVDLTFSIVYVDDAGTSHQAKLGEPIQARAGALSMAPLVVADFDQDGSEDVFVAIDSKHGAAPRLTQLWSHAPGKPTPLSRTPALPWHTSEQSSDEALPRLGTFGPFVRPLPRRCGARTCPSRITGPAVFAEWHEGRLGFDNAGSRAALRSACGVATSLVAQLDGAAHVQRTAHNVVCRRYRRHAPQALVSQLRDAAKALCSGESKCPALSELEKLALMPMPTALQALGPTQLK